jgi:hypothetical protein
MSIRIEQTTDAQQFQELENQVYANDPFHIPSGNAFPSIGKSFIAFEDDHPAACCHAQLQTDNPTIGTIGYFQALEKPAAVRAMLDAAVQWLESQDAQRILAPMDGDTWHNYRFNTGPFTEAPFIKEPWNPTTYPALIEAAGFKIAETYDSYSVGPAKAAANQKKFYDRCLKQGYTFHPITAKNFADMLPIIYQLSLRIFPDNVLYTPIREDEFIGMYLPAKPLMKDGLSWLAHDPDGNPAGYSFCFPDVADAMRAMNGKTNLAAKIRFLLNKKKAVRTCLKTLGVVPERRGSGLSAALTHLSYKHSAELGYRETLMCLMHSSNDSRRFSGNADRPFRTYALYEFKK